jgi:large subunit ribosomal protein L17
MHRHSYIGKKLSRTAAPRRALMRGLIDSLILYERIETTEVKAKALAREFDKLVTKAKKGDLHNYRQVLATTINPVAAEKLFTDLCKGFQSRNSGYSRVIKTGRRLGDGANMAIVELILDDGYASQIKQDKKVDKTLDSTKSDPDKVKSSSNKVATKGAAK